MLNDIELDLRSIRLMFQWLYEENLIMFSLDFIWRTIEMENNLHLYEDKEIEELIKDPNYKLFDLEEEFYTEIYKHKPFTEKDEQCFSAFNQIMFGEGWALNECHMTQEEYYDMIKDNENPYLQDYIKDYGEKLQRE